MTPPPEGTPWWAWLLAVIAVALIASGMTYLTNRPVRRGMQQVQAQVDVAAHEVRPNSGGSMADAVNRIEATVSVMRSEQIEQRRDIGGLRSDHRQVRSDLGQLREVVDGNAGETRLQHAALAKRLDDHLDRTASTD